jgi:hypothetical protein
MPETEKYVDLEIEVSANVAEHVRNIAKRRGVTVSALIALALTEYLVNV